MEMKELFEEVLNEEIQQNEKYNKIKKQIIKLKHSYPLTTEKEYKIMELTKELKKYEIKENLSEMAADEKANRIKSLQGQLAQVTDELRNVDGKDTARKQQITNKRFEIQKQLNTLKMAEVDKSEKKLKEWTEDPKLLKGNKKLHCNKCDKDFTSDFDIVKSVHKSQTFLHTKEHKGSITCPHCYSSDVVLKESEENKDYKEAFKKYFSERKKLKIKIDHEEDEKRKRELEREFANLKDEFYKKWH
jgi:hypothetical protein